MVTLDALIMPLCRPVVLLGQSWWWGEALAVALVLLPALALARWTLEDAHVRARATLQVVLAAGLFLYFVPELAFALRPGKGWEPWLQLAGWQRQLALQLLLVLALPGLNAVAEFAGRGLGTPIPYDAPRRLVTSGIYRYCANPMQLSCGLAMLLWAALLRNGWLLLAALLAIVYSAGIAEWDEGQDLANRFGLQWRQYRAQVRSWIPRWTPYHAGPPARLYVAATCSPCTELRAWLQARIPHGLEICDAESLPAGSIRRLLYDPADATATVDGVRALGRALEHLHLGWALAGAALRLPGIWQLVQLLMDASGFGPRDLENQSCASRFDRKKSNMDSSGIGEAAAGTKLNPSLRGESNAPFRV
jgi:protein-S-isoprenylcysteine O-methyltransferase Ste14